MKYYYGTLTVKDDELTTEEVREIWSQMHPEIQNADVEERDDGIHFVQRSGTKG